MNSRPPSATRVLELTAGIIRWRDRDGVAVQRRDGHPARAGDGIAAELVRMLAGAPLPPGLRCVVDLPLGTVDGRERGLGADVDMTNWNVIVDDRYIVKVVGRLGDGERAVRLARDIHRFAPEAVPALHGTIEFADAAGAGVVVTVHEYVPDSSDGWTWAVDDARASIEHHRESVWPRQLGELVARVHLALRSADVSRGRPHNNEPPALDVSQHAELLAGDDPMATRLRARWAHLTRVITTLPTGHAPRFPIHGDLHLGQVLRDSAGTLKLIDFDGDPQGGFSPDSADAAVDVAHMLVSLDMVGAILAKRQGHDHALIRWCDSARSTFLEGYRATEASSGDAPLLDNARLPALEAHQFLRELHYARDYLPRWQYAPDWAITHRFAPAPDLEDPPWTPPASSTT